MCFKLLMLFCFLSISASGQSVGEPMIHDVKQIKAVVDSARKNKPQERLYLHLDKFNYLSADTIWFKAYLLEGPYLMPSTKSGIFYVELVDELSNVISRMKFPVRYGLGWGNIGLAEKDLPTGHYVLRAYTNWMLNFGEEAVYTTSIYISNMGSVATKRAFNSGKKERSSMVKPNEGPYLTIRNPVDQPSVEVTIAVQDEPKYTSECYLVGQSRGVVCYAVPVNFNKGKMVANIMKEIFPTGIARFTLLDKKFKPLKEQLTYIDHHDQLKMRISTLNDKHKTQDSIALNIRVTDQEGKPVEGSFSLAITDDTGVKLKSETKQSNIVEYMLKNAELNRQSDDSLEFAKEWVGYNWKDILNTAPQKYKAEPEFLITGRVNSTFKGLAQAKVSLFSQKPLLIRDTVAAADGRFIFRNLPVADTTVYKIQATNKRGGNFLVTLEVDEWIPPVFKPFSRNDFVETDLQDTAFAKVVKNSIASRKQQEQLNGKMLNEVNIAAKKIVRGSYNLNGPGGADQIISENELQKEGKKTLYDLLFQKVSGLKIGSYVFPPSKIRKFGMMINGQLMKVVIDGVDADLTYHYYQIMDTADDEREGMQERYQFLKTNLEYFTAEDITGIEVMYNSQFNMNYNKKFLSTNELMFNKGGGLTGVGGVSGIDYAYVEVTTRSKKGPFMKPTPGTYLYKPLPFSLPLKFQSSGYGGTIHWEPNIVTNEKGEAVVSFRAGALPATYTIVMEGSDMNGQLGSVIKPAFITITQ
ncbi:hypothetical protein ABIE26_002206 [Pedobacter africanus]|uniref:Uncharacterized protein n=1 Tax=Pedobacter africanus TaxID=151894 RepID=A0ACC6KYG3_9SPHI|nr:carboxypeptidase-like regulatory domain-containing protein [Pedobacter africanus]MDR6784405.1 hypothetical protein [Pedobacter africanus]